MNKKEYKDKLQKNNSKRDKINFSWNNNKEIKYKLLILLMEITIYNLI